MFDIQIFNLNSCSYLRMTPEKDLAKAEKEKKDLYPQVCMEHRSTFTPMVYSAHTHTHTHTNTHTHIHKHTHTHTHTHTHIHTYTHTHTHNGVSVASGAPRYSGCV